jgi:hypothetical protein
MLPIGVGWGVRPGTLAMGHLARPKVPLQRSHHDFAQLLASSGVAFAQLIVSIDVRVFCDYRKPIQMPTQMPTSSAL